MTLKAIDKDDYIFVFDLERYTTSSLNCILGQEKRKCEMMWVGLYIDFAMDDVYLVRRMGEECIH